MRSGIWIWMLQWCSTETDDGFKLQINAWSGDGIALSMTIAELA